MRILLVEDDKLLADALSRALVQSAYAVDVVGSGDEADAALTQQVYDLAILDIGLPGLSGIEVRGSRDRKPPPPSAASAAVDAEDPKRARRAGRPFFPTAYMPPAPRAPRRGVR